jgi:hypothetical protein
MLKFVGLLASVLRASTFTEASEGSQKWAARTTVAADGSSNFTDMNLFLQATELSVPILAHSRLSRDCHLKTTSSDHRRLLPYPYSADPFFLKDHRLCYHQVHVSDPLLLLKEATDFYEIFKYHEHHFTAGHCTLVPPNFHTNIAAV